MAKVPPLVRVRGLRSLPKQWERRHSHGHYQLSVVSPTFSHVMVPAWVGHKWNSRRYFSTTNDSHQSMEGNETFSKIIRGNLVEFDWSRRIANLAESTVVGNSGDTVVLTTVAVGPSVTNNALEKYGSNGIFQNNIGNPKVLADALERKCRRENPSEMVPMTVDYRQRHHAVGKIPSSANRTDNRRPSIPETLASRSIDRSLRPLLRNERDSPIHLSCSVQSYPVTDNPEVTVLGGGHPVSLALNSASVALKDRLMEPVAAIVLTLMEDGSVLLNPSTASIQSHHKKSVNKNGLSGELLFAGTKESIVMMEFSGLIPESRLLDLIRLAHESIQPILKTQERILKNCKNGQYEDDNELKKQLGISIEEMKEESTQSSSIQQQIEGVVQTKADQIYDEAFEFVSSRLRDVVLRLFGARTENDVVNNELSRDHGKVGVHSEENDGPLLGKEVRARRETLVKNEIKHVLAQFKPADSQLAREYHALKEQDKSIIDTLGGSIHSKIMQEAMKDASIMYSCRADSRGNRSTRGNDTIRTLSMDVPALPDTVHGSAIFTRGETQVLCTTTLGPPKDGILQNDPYEPTMENLELLTNPDTPSKTLPVGSLRYLRSQEHLESDLNSRRVLADREQTGDSGTLRERRRAFLQYDFPAYCNGEIQTGPSGASRREIGHGALAEKAILPILPPPNEFPYAIRMTSEVTSSNGSSSMATVCGATLSLLDAGVPIIAPAAGVSIGLVQDGTTKSYQLLLDISGTEDHYGLMDFKVAGTAEKVSSMQLDVKQPLPVSLVEDALQLAKEGRAAILEEMKSQSTKSSNGVILDLSPRLELKNSAPRSSVVTFDPARKKDLLGPGGVVIRQMEDRFNVSLDLTQEGQCLLFGDDREMVRKAKAAVMDLVSDVEVGITYEGTIIEVRDFGLIIELLRNKEGLCHVSELATGDEIRNHPRGTLGLVNQSFSVGQKIDVVCTAVDPVQGTIRLRPATKKEAF